MLPIHYYEDGEFAINKMNDSDDEDCIDIVDVMLHLPIDVKIPVFDHNFIYSNNVQMIARKLILAFLFIYYL